MKRGAVYLVVLISILFVGLSTYYFAKNVESVALTIGENEVICLNVGEDYSIPFVHTKPSGKTKVEIVSENPDLVSVDAEKMLFVSSLTRGGSTNITIKTSNKKLPIFTITIRVGNGTSSNPYFVRSAADIAKIGNQLWTLSNSYELTADIDLSLLDRDWAPIGTEEIPFSGSFDGDLKTISNLKMENKELVSQKNAGLFGVISNSAKIAYVKLKNINISGMYDFAGALVAQNLGGAIENNEIFNDKNYSFSIKNTNTAGITGGIVGQSLYTNLVTPIISSCSIENVSIEGSRVGAIVGYLKAGVVINSYAKGVNVLVESMHVSGYVGGIVGKAENSYNAKGYIRRSVIKNVYNSSMSAVAPGAILKGAILGEDLKTTPTEKTIIIGTYFMSDGFIAKACSSYEIDAEYSKSITIQDIEVKETFKTFKGNTAPLASTEYTTWNFENIWSFEKGRPTLIYDSIYEQPGIFEQGDSISSFSEFKNISQYTTGDFELTGDIVFTEEWTPIAEFDGTIDGKGFALKNVTFTNNLLNSGLFVKLGNRAVIKNLIIENVVIKNSKNIGTVATNNQGLIENITIKHLKVESTSGTVFGGIAGNNSGIISECKVLHSDIDTEGLTTVILTDFATVGGIAGNNDAGNVLKSDANITFKLQNPNTLLTYGGIVGKMNGSSVINGCGFFAGSLSIASSKPVIGGGIVGNNDGGKIEKSFVSTGNVVESESDKTTIGGIAGLSYYGTIDSSYAIGKVNGYRAGGIVGHIMGGSVRNSYFSGDISGKLIAGLAFSMEKEAYIYSSYAIASLTGSSASGLMCGYAVYNESYSKVENCFVSTSFAGNGERWVETRSAVGVIAAPFQVNTAGYIYNSVYNTSTVGGATEQTRFILWPPFTRKGTNLIDKTNNDICVGVGGFAKFINDAKFDQSIWRFQEGFFPELKSCDFGENTQPSQIVED